MSITTISSREFNQAVSRAKRAADRGLVVITDRGEPAYVLLRHEAYLRLIDEQGPNIVEMLFDPNAADLEFEPPKLDDLIAPPRLDD